MAFPEIASGFLFVPDPAAMPIYAYKCASCGHADDVLQKLADAPLSVCPKCGKAAYSKQITAPQFQLKGSGWYVTDFRGGSSTAAKKDDDKPATEVKPEAAKTETAKADAPAATPAAKPAESKPAAPATATE
jgi:putative FmdB family regulatory protein